MNQEQLVTFCKQIIKLKDQLKCPICLEIIEETAELPCGHRLCNDCYTTQKNITNECPLCKFAFTRRSLVYKDEFVNIVGTFLSKMCNKIEKATKLTIEEIVHSELDEPLIRKTTRHSTKKQVEDKPSSTYIDTLFPKKRVYKPVVKNCSIIKSVENVPSTSQEDPFDKLTKKPQALCLNKKGTRIKYTRQEKDKQENREYKILDFQNNDTKNAVIQWLNDNRNKFDRLTQTQAHIENFEEPKEVFSIDLPSVSQVKRKSKTINTASKTTENQIKHDSNMKKTGKSRARSLDLDLNKSKKEANRLSDTGLVENYIIECNTEDLLKKAEENVLLNIIEDEYLNKLENQLQKSCEKIKPHELPAAELNNKENEGHTTQSSASGWKRIENMSKTIKKKGKSPKKLNISLQPQNINVSKEPETHVSNNQKMNISQSYWNESISELLNFGEVMNNLKTNLERRFESADKNLSERDINSIKKHLEKLNDFYTVTQQNKITSNTGTQTDDFECQECVRNKECLKTNIEERRGIHVSTHYSEQDMGTQCNLTELLVRDISQNVQAEQPNNLEDKELHDGFSDSLDLVHVETQALEKMYLTNKQAKSSQTEKPLTNEKASKNGTPPITINDMINNPEDQNDIPSSAKQNPDELICSLKSDRLEKSEGNVSNKRTRSDSYSSDIAVPKKRCNRFIREDLSIEFDASEKPQLDKSGGTVGLSLESDGENDEEYLDNILKKYNVPIPSKSQDQQVDKDCADIIAQVKQNVEKLKRKSDESSSYKTATPNSMNGLDDDNLFLNDQNLSKLDNDIQMHTESKNDTFDVVTETENFEPSLKKPKLRSLDKAFDKGEIPKLSMSEESHPISPIKNKNTFCPELEDSFDEVDFENILKEEEAKKSENKDVAVGKSNDDDLFSDEDVVDTTPQKEKTILDRRSPINIVTNLSTRFLDEDNVDNAFDAYFAPLAPPPGFEDDIDDATSCDITVINVPPKEDKEQTSTATPENKIEDAGNQMNCTTLTPLNIHLQKQLHSTPHSQFHSEKSVLGLSPIVQEKSLFEKANDSANKIISISSQDTPRKKNNILTSRPNQISILNYVVVPPSSQPKSKPCIACTRLTKDQTQSISLLTNRKLATYSAKFNDTVTHMVVAVDESRRIKDYTMKFVSAVASGIWVLGFEWVQECLKNNAIVPEEQYEAFDDTGNTGPKIARLTRQENPLFKGYLFYCVRSLYSITVEEVEDVITKLGAMTVRNLNNLLENDGKIKLIITEGRSTQDFEIYEKWLEKYKIVTVDIEWLSRSVGRYKILSVRPYIWCSDDMLDDLGYPPYLVENSSSISTLSEHM